MRVSTLVAPLREVVSIWAIFQAKALRQYGSRKEELSNYETIPGDLCDRSLPLCFGDVFEDVLDGSDARNYSSYPLSRRDRREAFLKPRASQTCGSDLGCT